MAKHGADFLSGQLERTITNKQDGSAAAGLLGSESGTLASTDGPADAAPEDLAHGCDVLGELGVPDTKVGGAGLGDDNVVGAKELADAGPQPGVLDDSLGLVGGGLVLETVDDLAVLPGGMGADEVGQLDEDAAHAHAGIGGVADDAVVAVEVDGVELRGLVGEAGGVEVALEAADGQDQVGRLNGLLDVRVRAATGVDADVVGVLLVDAALAHGGDEDGDVGPVDEGVDLVQDAMAHGAGVDQNDGLLGGVEVLEGDVDDVVLLLGVVGGLRQVDGGLEPGSVDGGLGHVGRQHDVDGPRLDPALSQGVVDLDGDVGRVDQLGDVAGDGSAHVGEDVKVAVAQGVMEEHAIALRLGRGAADDVDDGDVLRVGAGGAVDGGELTDAKGGEEGAHAIDTGVAVGGVGGVELVDAADPVEAALEEVVERDEVVVAGKTVDGAYADLVESLEEVLRHGHALVSWFLGKRAHDARVCVCGRVGDLLPLVHFPAESIVLC